jgi:LmbE family N-acetylglucosaminyl deacetylase
MLLHRTGLAGAFAAAAGVSFWEAIGDPDRAPAATERGRAPSRSSIVQIVAHPDDDLYFINPLAWQDITDAASLATVYLSAGESDGRNISIRTSGRKAVPVDYPGYVEARRNGIRSAYSLMATGRDDAPWQVSAVRLGSGLVVERSVLKSEPGIALYFVGTRLVGALRADEAGNPSVRSLRTLWSGVASAQLTQPAATSPVREAQQVGREELITALVTLLQQRRPTLLRLLDPDPDRAPGPSARSSDHPDHTASAEFGIAALGRYVAAGGAMPAVEHFRGYSNAWWPKNLTPASYDHKSSALLVYGGSGRPDCYATMCGDLELGEDDQIQYGFSTWRRYPHATGWLIPQADGTLAAVGALGGQLACWRGGPGGASPWNAAQTISAQGYVAPAVSTVRGPDGLLTLLALRRTTAPGGDPVVEVVWSGQRGGSLAFSDWQSLGSPGPDAVRARETGIPVGAFDNRGVLSVFVRDYRRGISVIQRSPAGEWGAWRPTAGPDPCQDGLAVLTRSSGVVEAYAPSSRGIVRIQQSAAGAGDFTARKVLGAQVPASPLTAVESKDGRAVLLYRPPRSADIAVSMEAKSSARWTATTVTGAGGIGPIGIAPWYDGARSGSLLYLTGDDGRLMTAPTAEPGALGAGRGAAPAWRMAEGPALVGTASAIQASPGTIAAACLGNDGRLWTAVQRIDRLADGFTAWASVK